MTPSRDRLTDWLGGLIAVTGAASWIFRYSAAVSDLSWHLAAGREILRRASVPLTDPFSYTFQGQPWLNHEWLWQAVYWLAFDIHPDVAAWLNVGVLALIFSLIYLAALETGGSVPGAVLATWLAAATGFWFFDIRPHLFTLLFVALVLATRRHRCAPWLWPGLILLWTNVHGGFVFGIGTIGLLVLVRTVEQSLTEKRLTVSWREWGAVAGCLVIWIANPWGWSLIEYPLAYLEGTAYRSLNEWRSTPFGLSPWTFEGRFWWTLLLAGGGAIVGARRQRYLLALNLVTVAMSISSRRFIPLFLVTSAPLVALGIGWLLQRARVRFGEPSRRIRSAAAVAALLLALASWRGVRVGPELLQRWASYHSNPAAAVKYLNELDGVRRVLNHYSWGGFVILRGEGRQVFIDERANTIYDDQIYLDYIALLQGAPGGLERLRRDPPDAALVPRTGIARTLMSLPRPWIPIYIDARALLLVPPDSPLLRQPLPDPRLVLGDEPDLLLAEAEELRRAGRLDEAIARVTQAIDANPLVLRSHAALAMLHAERGDVAAIAATIDRGIEASPRHRKRLRHFEARAYRAAGDLERALIALRAAMPYGPFDVRSVRIAEIEEVESALSR